MRLHTSLSVATFVTTEPYSDSSGLLKRVIRPGATAAMRDVACLDDLGTWIFEAAIETPFVLRLYSWPSTLLLFVSKIIVVFVLSSDSTQPIDKSHAAA